MSVIDSTAHRPYPISQAPWLMSQTWNHLLFAHWAIPVSCIRDFVPAELAIDTFEGFAWVGVVPFGMSRIHLRGLPPLPFTNQFPEINVRTYVTYNETPGVFFFSLDATNLLAVMMARAIFSLPYFQASIELTCIGDNIHYTSRRVHKKAPTADFEAIYRPVSPIFHAESGSLDSFLTDRYCLYCIRRAALCRGEIHHIRWPLQRAEANFIVQNMIPFDHPNFIRSKPVLHYSEKIEALIWPLVKSVMN